MRWLRCSYPELLALPDGYIEVAGEIAKQEARAARAESQSRRRRR